MNPSFGYTVCNDVGRADPPPSVWGFVEERIGKGSHRRFMHPATKKEIWVSVHTKKDVGRLARRILKDAGLE